jgi:Uma2 family endonuclease
MISAMHAQPAEMTLDEWAELDEDTQGELVDGVLVEEEVPNWIHETVITWLTCTLDAWLGARGWVAGSGIKYGLRPRRGRIPDLTVFLGRRPPPRGLVRTPPDIAVEVTTATPRDERRDRIEKYDEYAAFGIRLYWVVDPELRSFEVFELGEDSRYRRACAATDAAIEAVPGCPGLRLDVPSLWKRLDELEADDAHEPSGSSGEAADD